MLVDVGPHTAQVWMYEWESLYRRVLVDVGEIKCKMTRDDDEDETYGLGIPIQTQQLQVRYPLRRRPLNHNLGPYAGLSPRIPDLGSCYLRIDLFNPWTSYVQYQTA